MSAVINLSWPNRNLSPNARVHRHAKARSTKEARREAFFATKAAGLRPGDVPAGAAVRFTLHKPNAQIDDDNAIAWMKAYQDGIADALGRTDHGLRVSWAFGEPRKPGAVVVEIEP